MHQELFRDLLPDGCKFMVREPSKMIDVLGSLKVPHFLLHLHNVALAVSHFHGLNEFVHIFEGVAFGLLFLFDVHFERVNIRIDINA